MFPGINPVDGVKPGDILIGAVMIMADMQVDLILVL